MQKKIEEYDNRNSRSEDEVSEPGEDQALVGNSSLRGSSSALTGAGAVHHPLSGSDSTDIITATSSLEKIPSYRPHSENEEDSAKLLSSHINKNLHESIEDGVFADSNEIQYGGFNLHSNTNNFSGGFPCGEWDFSGLDENHVKIQSETGSGDDISSERAQCDSCPSEISDEDLYKDLEDVSTDDDDKPFIVGSYAPDIDDENRSAKISIQHDIHDEMSHENGKFPEPQFVTGDNLVNDEELATDIRLEDLEELKVE